MASVSIDEGDLKRLLADRDEARAHVTALQAEATKARDRQLSIRVREFHAKFGHPVRTTPAVPRDEEVRFRLSLIAEEFIELLEACVDTSSPERSKWEQLGQAASVAIREVINGAPLAVDLPEAYDALLDIAYVVEGTHAVFGTTAEPGFAEVQRANMSKDPVYVRVKDCSHAGRSIGAGGGDEDAEEPDPKAKPRKPADWTPPDVRAVLVKQGWRPTLSDLVAAAS